MAYASSSFGGVGYSGCWSGNRFFFFSSYCYVIYSNIVARWVYSYRLIIATCCNRFERRNAIHIYSKSN